MSLGFMCRVSGHVTKTLG